MNYDELIKNWHTKASDEDYFLKFVFEYLAFIAFLKRKKFTNAHTDRAAIQSLKQDEKTKEAYLSEINTATSLSDAWERIREELNRAPLGDASGSGDEVEEIRWWNCSHKTLEEQVVNEREKLKGVIYDFYDWGNMVEFWYSIRNNLFHGSKNPQNKRDQVLVENGYKTLQPLVEIFLFRQE